MTKPKLPKRWKRSDVEKLRFARKALTIIRLKKDMFDNTEDPHGRARPGDCDGRRRGGRPQDHRRRGDPMKALTIWQPWADAIRCGAKMFETRSFATRYRGELAIHASKHEPSCVTEHVAVSEAAQAIEWSGLRAGCTHAHGAIIAVASLLGCYPTDAIPEWYIDEAKGSRCEFRMRLVPMHKEEHALGDFSAGRFAWLFWVLSPVDPVVPCKGAQGLWTVPTDVEQLVRTRARLP